MKLQVREARIEDKNEILSVIGSSIKWDRPIAKRYYDDYFPNIELFKGDKVYVLTSGVKVIGVIGYFVDRYETGNYWLGWFYVQKNYQGKTHGKKLLEYIIKKLKSKGVKRLFVNTSSNKKYNKALAIYRDKEFRIEAVIRDYYEKGEDQIILSRNVS